MSKRTTETGAHDWAASHIDAFTRNLSEGHEVECRVRQTDHALVLVVTDGLNAPEDTASVVDVSAIAARGLSDPAALTPEDVQALCAAMLAKKE